MTITYHSHCIVVPSHNRSIESGYRVMESAKNHGWDSLNQVHLFFGFTPSNDDVEGIFRDESIDYTGFLNSKYSREKNAMACFLSHYSLWKRISQMDDESNVQIIFEHDAVIDKDFSVLHSQMGKIRHCCNIGKPSFGRYAKIKRFGVHPLFSKPYFPGAHAYVIKPSGARMLIDNAREHGACPTDVFLSRNRFPWLQEMVPWIAHVDESFTTVQKETGCIAKHQYNDEYEIL